MSKITADSTPILTGEKEWNLADYVEFHKALANKYYTNTTLVKKDDVVLAKNVSADSIWLGWYLRANAFSKVQMQILSPLSEYDNSRKYLGMWDALGKATGSKFLMFNPVWASVKITGDVAKAIGSGLMTGLKVAKYAIPVVGVLLVLAVSAYIFNSFKRKTRYV